MPDIHPANPRADGAEWCCTQKTLHAAAHVIHFVHSQRRGATVHYNDGAARNVVFVSACSSVSERFVCLVPTYARAEIRTL